VKLALHLIDLKWPGGPEALGPTLAALARRAEAAGFVSLSVMDHLFQNPVAGRVEDPMTEAYTTLGFLAGVTERLRLGALVTAVTFREPGLLVKQVTTLDVLSGGRAFFGVGAAWYEREHVGLGFAFPPVAERFGRLEELLRIAKQMWSGEVGPFEGHYYKLAETLCSPMPLQRPHPPIMIGGAGEQKTLKLVARYADACNLFANLGTETLRHKLEVLRRHCEAEGRDYEAIEKSVNTRLILKDVTPAQFVEQCRELRGLGITWVNCGIPDANEEGVLERIGREIVPAIAGL
jgi:F420-dependent oxidoreductase-like protein